MILKKNQYRFFLMVLIIFLTTQVYSQEKSYNSRLLSDTPSVDGKVDGDKAWDEQPWTGDFFKLGSTEQAEKQTSFKVGYTATALYFAIKCIESDVDKLSVNYGDEEDVWRDDSVELFIASLTSSDYYHLIINAAGFRWNARGEALVSDSLWNWKAAVGKENEYFVVEIMIPFEIFEKFPTAQEVWAINVTRNSQDKTGNFNYRHSTWMPLESFVEIAKFGKLVFCDGVSDSPEALEIIEKIVNERKNKADEILSTGKILSDESMQICEAVGFDSRLIGDINHELEQIRNDLDKISELAQAANALKTADMVYKKAEKIKTHVLVSSFFMRGSAFDGMAEKNTSF